MNVEQGGFEIKGIPLSPFPRLMSLLARPLGCSVKDAMHATVRAHLSSPSAHRLPKRGLVR